MATIGGGHLLVPVASKIKKPTEQQLACLLELESDAPLVRAAAALYFHGLRDWHDSDLARLAGIGNAKKAAEKLVSEKSVVRLKVSPTRTARLERRMLDEWANRIAGVLQHAHEQDKLKIYVDRSWVHTRFQYLDDRPLIDAILGWMHRQNLIRQTELGVALASHAPKLSPKQQQAMDAIVAAFHQGGFQPPSVADCNKMLPKQEKEVAKLIKLAVGEGRLVHVGQQIYLHSEFVAKLKETLHQSLSTGDGMTLSAIRELLETTRKFAVPICEYLDRIGFTPQKRRPPRFGAKELKWCRDGHDRIRGISCLRTHRVGCCGN